MNIGKLMIIFVPLIALVITFENAFSFACSRNDDDHDGYSGHGGGYGKYRSRSSYGRGGRSGGGGSKGGCFAKNTMVWTKNETQPDKDAIRISVNYLKEGQLVSTMALHASSEVNHGTAWTRATDVTTYRGHFKVHTFTLSTGHQLTVTSPHIMIIWRNKIPYFLRADHVTKGDEMSIQETITRVTMVEIKMVDTKVAIETEDGTIHVNGVLASSFCDDDPDAFHKMMKVDPMIENYKSNHFGEAYKSMCMDTIAWKNNHMINNGFSL